MNRRSILKFLSFAPLTAIPAFAVAKIKFDNIDPERIVEATSNNPNRNRGLTAWVRAHHRGDVSDGIMVKGRWRSRSKMTQSWERTRVDRL